MVYLMQPLHSHEMSVYIPSQKHVPVLIIELRMRSAYKPGAHHSLFRYHHAAISLSRALVSFHCFGDRPAGWWSAVPI